MNLSFLDKTSKVTPLLVRMYDSQKLNAAAKDRAPEALAELTTAICELLDMSLTARESELVADVMIGLIRQAEIDFRQAVAEKLSSLENVPLRLVLELSSDEISVANPILRHSEVLSDLDLIYIIKSKSNEHWQAIANRQKMSDQVMNMLADTGDVYTAVQLVQNQSIKLNEYVITALSDMAQENEVVARPLLRREEVPPTIAQKLYQFVGEELKFYINERYGITKGDVTEAIDNALLDLMDASENEDEFMPTMAMVKDAQRQKEKGLLTIPLMLGSLRRGQIKPFVAQFAQYTGLNVPSVLEILNQGSGQGLAVACRAVGVAKEDFMSIFLLTNRMRNFERMVEIGDMTKAASYFIKLDRKMAQNILENSQRK
ncbi:MAG: DUF2336 domain-containing protein [Micavibrio sp.]|nr:DUF2336 domain-containing protein [Micavibrio sp.]